MRCDALPVMMVFSRVDELAWQLLTLGATTEICSQLLSQTEFPAPDYAKFWHARCMYVLNAQLSAKYSPTSAALAAGGGGASGAATQQEGSTGTHPSRR